MDITWKQTKKVLRSFLEFISLSTPVSRIIIFLGVLFILLVIPTENLDILPVRSIYESMFDLQTYSSGITRSVSMILHGNFQSAWELNKLSFVLLLVVFILIVKDLWILLREDKRL